MSSPMKIMKMVVCAAMVSSIVTGCIVKQGDGADAGTDGGGGAEMPSGTGGTAGTMTMHYSDACLNAAGAPVPTGTPCHGGACSASAVCVQQ